MFVITTFLLAVLNVPRFHFSVIVCVLFDQSLQYCGFQIMFDDVQKRESAGVSGGVLV